MTAPRDNKIGQRLSAEQTRRLLRWRMALGRYADNQLGSSGLSAEDLRRDQLCGLSTLASWARALASSSLIAFVARA